MANNGSVTPAAVEGGQVGLNSLKAQMQKMISEMTTYRDNYYKNVKDLEAEKAKKDEYVVEVTTLNRKIVTMEDEYEQLTRKLQATTQKYEETVKAADECERHRRALEHRRNIDEDRLAVLEQMLRETQEAGVESEKKYDEVSRKLLMTEADLARAEANTEKAEVKAKGLQEDMRALANKLKAMQVRVEKAGDLEEKYEKTIADLQARLKSTERHASDSESTVVKLQREVDHLRDELLQTKMQYQSLRQELDPYSHEIRAN